MLTSLFGDCDEDEYDEDNIDAEQIQRILDSLVAVPKLISPIKDWPEDIHIETPPLIDLDAEPLERIKAPPTNVPSIERSLSPPPNETSTSAISSIESEVPNEDPANITDEPNKIEEVSLESPNQLECITNTIDSIVHEPNTIEEIPGDSICTEFDSPASPKPDDQLTTSEPPTIPIEPRINKSNSNETISEQSLVSTDSALDQIIYNYSPRMQNAFQNQDNEDCYLLASLRNAIEMYCRKKEWTSDSTPQVIEKLFALSRRPKHLAAAILEVVEDTKESLSMEFTPPAPALQPSHQKCLVLVSRLTKLMPAFDKYVQFELERKLFNFQANERQIYTMVNLTHFFIALNDIDQPTNRAEIRMFIYKCLYYFKMATIPLVFTVIMAHPHAIPHAKAMETITDPLIRAIVSSLSNIVYTDSEQTKSIKVYKKSEMFYTLKRRYGFFMDKLFPIDSIVDYCIELIQANRLQHVDYALILIAKRQDVEYAVQKIIDKHLMPMLQQYFTLNVFLNAEHDGKICTILFTMASIVKTFPLEHDITKYLDIFVTCLNATHRQSIQEAAVAAICQLNRFGTTRIYRQLAVWRPNYTLSPHIQAMLYTITYRKTKSFWFSENRNHKMLETIE